VKTTLLGEERCIDSPAICGLRDDLVAAWVTPAGELRVAVGDGLGVHRTPTGRVVPGDYEPRQVTTVATGAHAVVGVAALRGFPHVAWQAADGSVLLARSDDGVTWDSPQLVPVQSREGVQVAVGDDRLWISFVEAAGGNARLIGWDGSAFTRVFDLDLRALSPPAIAVVPDPLALPRLYVAVADQGGQVLLASAPAGGLGALVGAFRPVPDATAVGLSLAAPSDGGVALATFGRGESAVRSLRAPPGGSVQVDRVDSVSEPHEAGPRLGAVDGELFLGFAQHGSPGFGSFVRTCELGADPRLGTRCDPGACAPDPRIACVAGEEAVVWRPARIDNARKGDLVLLPADGSGLIGTLLGAVQPAQYHDHMGIMVEDYTVVRHCTASKDRMMEERYYTGVVLGEWVPSDGIREDHMTYGWPGAMTQTVEDAFFTGLRGAYNPEWSYERVYLGRDPQELPPEFLDVPPVERRARFGPVWDGLCFFDPERVATLAFASLPGDLQARLLLELGFDSIPERVPLELVRSRLDPVELEKLRRDQCFRYTIQNMPHNPAARAGGLFWPIVVRPPLDDERRLPWVRPLLHLVADHSLSLRAHYRFFAYTRSAISVDGSKEPPAAGDPYWASVARSYPFAGDAGGDGADWPAGTSPMVCSTFVWAAVKAVEHALGGRPIELEGAPEPTANHDPTQAHRAPASPDGLYAYTASERQDAGTALHERLKDTVESTIKQQKGGVGGLVAGLAATIADMADDVATQACNCFAVDRADDKDDGLWEQPGTGEAVGPDDVLQHWDAPAARAGGEGFHGLYGDAEPADLVEGGYEWAPVHAYRLADGMAHIRCRVRADDPETGHERIVPAVVRVGCTSAVTDADGFARALVPVGRTRIGASAWDAVDDVPLKYEGYHDLHDGRDELEIKLEPPPRWRRRAVLSGETRIHHNPTIGSLAEDTQPIAEARTLAWDPALASNAQGSPAWTYMTTWTTGGKSTDFDGTFVRYKVELELTEQLVLLYRCEFEFSVGGDLHDDQRRVREGHLDPETSAEEKYEVRYDDLESQNYGRVSLRIANTWAKAMRDGPVP
jgi:hypothetical protein